MVWSLWIKVLCDPDTNVCLVTARNTQWLIELVAKLIDCEYISKIWLQNEKDKDEQSDKS